MDLPTDFDVVEMISIVSALPERSLILDRADYLFW